MAGAVAACSSGIELSRSGFADDVAIATELDTSVIVPVLTDGAFSHRTDATGSLPNL
ncbi:phosphosulfolactate phosphohydrolase-like enzyme [Streptomyces iranensis]|uniref:Phosphosulfolactate phosphohydrolase-like enzyme n=1 Tax=Streptomyces iranensis TaxID=576784 RepID=A0ABS4N6K0_9ACTN|nr:phosphosulfolactate phosphohydrolase-like enzyme [Streptomyces iranensis]